MYILNILVVIIVSTVESGYKELLTEVKLRKYVGKSLRIMWLKLCIFTHRLRTKYVDGVGEGTTS